MFPAIALLRHRKVPCGETVLLQGVVQGLAQHLGGCRDLVVPLHSYQYCKSGWCPFDWRTE
jgi:hypothetical protein